MDGAPMENVDDARTTELSALAQQSPREASLGAAPETPSLQTGGSVRDVNENELGDVFLPEDAESNPKRELDVALAFGSEDHVIEIVAELVDESLAISLDAFYERRLCGYAAKWLVDCMFEVILPASVAPFPTRDLESSHLTSPDSDPALHVLHPPRHTLREPLPNEIDPFSRHEIPLRAPTESDPLSSKIGSSSIASARASRHSHGASVTRGSLSHPSPRSSFRTRVSSLSYASSPPTSPRSAYATHGSFAAAGAPEVYQQHAPGVVYSTAPPPRMSPRKATVALKNAHRMSNSSSSGKRGSAVSDCDAEEKTLAEDGSDTGGAATHPDVNDAHTSAKKENSNPFFDGNAPIEVEFVVKRSRASSQLERDGYSAVQLPELSPRRRLNRSEPQPMTDPELARTSGNTHKRAGRLANGTSSDLPREVERADLFHEDAGSIQTHIKSMVLSPGVKLQDGEETKTGGELPLFPTKMRRATFYVRGFAVDAVRCFLRFAI